MSPVIAIETFPNQSLRYYGITRRLRERNADLDNLNDLGTALKDALETIDGIIEARVVTDAFAMSVSLAAAFSWDDVEPRILAAIATIGYGVQVKDVEIRRRSIGLTSEVNTSGL